MKIAEKIINKFYENLPKNTELGKVYNKVIVDGETFRKMELISINPNQAKLVFKGPNSEHTFNYVEQEIVLK
jgi:hypothetical protein